MYSEFLTKQSSAILGPIARLLGLLMNYIFKLLNVIGIPNIGLAIILFTIVIYMALMPLTVKQQKFSKLQTKMQPELNAIQKKYKDKKDNDSMMAMNQETQAVYKKYGVSATGSCVQLIIQMPILFALYRVIYNIPAYVDQVKEAFFPLVDNLIAIKGSAEYLQETTAAAQFARQFTNESFTSGVTEYVQNTYIDVLNKFSSADWSLLAERFSAVSADITSTVTKLDHYNNFLGINIGNSPSYMFKEGWADKSILVMIAALIIPILSAVTQWLNVKMMPTADTPQKSGNEQADTMMQSMKTMNTLMPLMSAWFCFTLPAGMGLYWVAGAVIRCVQQIFINRHIDRMDIDEMIKKNLEKQKKIAEKRGDKPTAYEKMMQYSAMNTKSIDGQNSAGGQTQPPKRRATTSEKARSVRPSESMEKDFEAAKAKTAGKKYKEGSLAEKANMVSKYNDVSK